MRNKSFLPVLTMSLAGMSVQTLAAGPEIDCSAADKSVKISIYAPHYSKSDRAYVLEIADKPVAGIAGPTYKMQAEGKISEDDFSVRIWFLDTPLEATHSQEVTAGYLSGKKVNGKWALIFKSPDHQGKQTHLECNR